MTKSISPLRIYLCIRALAKDATFMRQLAAISSNITVHPSTARPSRQELVDIVKNYEIIICGINEQLDSQVASEVGKLRIIASLSSGSDHIAIPAFEAMGVKIITLPGANAVSVAEHTWALILALVKALCEGDAAVRNRVGRRGMTNRPIELRGKSLGIVGAGRIAYEVARIGSCLGVKLSIWTLEPARHPEFNALNVTFSTDLGELIKRSDIVTIHLPLNDQTRSLIGADLLMQARVPLVLVNTSRAELLQPDALKIAFERGFVTMCGLDVYTDSDITDLPAHQVLFSPHIAGLTRESVSAMRQELVRELALAVDQLSEGGPNGELVQPRR